MNKKNKFLLSVAVFFTVCFLIIAGTNVSVYFDEATNECNQKVMFSNALYADNFYHMNGTIWGSGTLSAVAGQTAADILYAVDATTLGRLPIDAGKYLKANSGGTGYEFAAAGGGNPTTTRISASGTAAVNTVYSNYAATQAYEMDLPLGAATHQYLEKEKDTEYGVKASYWQVTHIGISLVGNTASVGLRGFKDLEAFKTGGREMSNVSVKIADIGKLQCYQAVFTEVLTKLQASEEFKGAQFKTWDDPVE